MQAKLNYVFACHNMVSLVPSTAENQTLLNTRFITVERELLSIVETLKEYRKNLFGQKIIVNSDHANLTYKYFNYDRVMR
jgi:hypothetical protein